MAIKYDDVLGARCTHLGRKSVLKCHDVLASKMGASKSFREILVQALWSWSLPILLRKQAMDINNHPEAGIDIEENLGLFVLRKHTLPSPSNGVFRNVRQTPTNLQRCLNKSSVKVYRLVTCRVRFRSFKSCNSKKSAALSLCSKLAVFPTLQRWWIGFHSPIEGDISSLFWSATMADLKWGLSTRFDCGRASAK